MQQTRMSAVGIVALGIGLMLPVLYLLSIGPYLAYSHGSWPGWAIPFYAPLTWLVNHSQTANLALEWYLGLWTGEDGVI